MGDIVERAAHLRHIADAMRAGPWPSSGITNGAAANTCEDAADELERLYRPWQPIETAPSEKRVWLYIPSFPAPANQMMAGLKYRDVDFWHVEHASVAVLRPPNTPTHWMPLPEPPNEG